MSHGALWQADSIERTAQVCRASYFDEERPLARAEPSAHGRQTPGQARPVKAASRRSRAREAQALTGVGWSGIASIRDDGSAAPSRANSSATCIDLLSAILTMCDDARKI